MIVPAILFTLLGRSLSSRVAVIGLAGLAVASPRAEGQDCSGEARPSFVSHSEFDHLGYSVALSGRYAYLVESFDVPFWGFPQLHFRFDIFDVIGSAQRASVSIDDSPCIEADGRFVYLGGPEFRILDVSDPTPLQIVGTCPTSQYVWDIAVAMPYAYLADSAGLSILDVSDPTSPTPDGSVATPEAALSVAVNGSCAHVAAAAVGLSVVDISDPASPMAVGTWALPGPAWDIAQRGSHVYIADGVGPQVLDVSQPQNPQPVGSADTPFDARRVAVSDARVPDSRARAYVADWPATLQTIDIADPTHPVIVRLIVDVPVRESWDIRRHAEPRYVAVNEARVAMAGVVVHQFLGVCGGAATGSLAICT